METLGGSCYGGSLVEKEGPAKPTVTRPEATRVGLPGSKGGIFHFGWPIVRADIQTSKE